MDQNLFKKKKKKIIKEQTDAIRSETRSVKHKMSSQHESIINSRATGPGCRAGQ